MSFLKNLSFVFVLMLLLHCEAVDSNPETQKSHRPKQLAGKEVYGRVSRQKYLIGDYSSRKHLKYYKEPVNGRGFYLRKDVYRQFKKMQSAYYKAAMKKKIGVKKIFIRSAFRSFRDQKYIWESKYTGKRKMSKSVVGKTGEQKVNLILEYSSAPGTSRHHWGTDIDINAFQNAYFKKGGQGEFLYSWLQNNAHKYGFCQPYTELEKRNNQGYYEERWHWSYAPVSNLLLNDWNQEYEAGHLDFKKHQGDKYLLQKRPIYVNSINPSCADIEKPVL